MNSLLLFIVQKIFCLIPDTQGFTIKRVLLRLAGVEVGKNVRICSTVRIIGNKKLIIGNNTWIGHNTLIVVSEDVTIGSDVNIAPRVYIGTGTHDINPAGPSVAGKGKSLPIVIKDGAWLCANSQFLAGVTVGQCSIVAMGGVVLEDVPPREVWGGVPAKFIRQLQ